VSLPSTGKSVVGPPIITNWLSKEEGDVGGIVRETGKHFK